MTRDDEKRQKLQALTKLAIATREKAEPQTFVVYLEGLEFFDAPTVATACANLIGRATWFPKVAELVEECRAILRVQAERNAERRRLSAPPPVPISPERHAEIMARFRAILHEKGMR